MKLVYVIYSSVNQAIKVGYASNINQRFSAIQLSTSEPLELLFVLKGGAEVEAELHNLLVNYRLRGEWFIFNEKVLSIIYFYQQSVIDRMTFNKNKENLVVHSIKEFCIEYLQTYKTKKRTRIPLKYLRDCCLNMDDITPDIIKDIMVNLGYSVNKDYHNSIYFTNVNNEN